jgi:hypothetical protein
VPFSWYNILKAGTLTIKKGTDADENSNAILYLNLSRGSWHCI